MRGEGAQQCWVHTLLMRDLGGDPPVWLGDGLRDGAAVGALIGDGLSHLAFTEVPPLLADRYALFQGELVDRVALCDVGNVLAHPRLGDAKLVCDHKLGSAVYVLLPRTIALDFCFFLLGK